MELQRNWIAQLRIGWKTHSARNAQWDEDFHYYAGELLFLFYSSIRTSGADPLKEAYITEEYCCTRLATFGTILLN